ncbi:DNA polymerase (pol2) family protein [Theileria parva strain Muguga]|uniref:DNA polymerase (pol2) family protein n=1 Tax=Theileria parva strain Muguga TaxID=333668 RepID=UPI001C61DFC0|nr:DNA polymerase (pol2) family protein [Theileria parva strain Muguga]EAN30937.2 DNA polymerase (pol2) family protein [Theileria parva strain Muguga]
MVKNKKNVIESALSKLRNQREGKANLIDEYQVEDENDQIYEIITEEEFNERNRKRKLEDFIEGPDYSDDEEDLELLEEQVERLGRKASKGVPHGKSIQQHFIEMAAQDSLSYHQPKPTETDKALLERLTKFEEELDNDTNDLGPTVLQNQFVTPQMYTQPSYLSQALMQASAEAHLPENLFKAYQPGIALVHQSQEMVEEPKIDSAILESFREVEMDEDVVIDSGQSPPQYTQPDALTLSEDLAFYLLDLCEDGGYLQLFGRIRTSGTDTESCMVTVKNMYRSLFFKPRMDLLFNELGEVVETASDGVIKSSDPLYERHLMMNFFNEFEVIRKDYGIKKIKYKLVKRSLLTYGPTKPEFYIKVCYPFQFQILNKQHLSGKFYEDVYHNHSTQVELFLLKRRIKGPTWLRLTDYQKSTDSLSYCKVEIEIDSHKNVQLWHSKNNEELFTPKLNILSISIKTLFTTPTHQEVFIISCVYNKYNIDETAMKDNYQFIGIRKPQNLQWPNELKHFLEKRNYFRIFEQERGLLAYFMNYLRGIDPDVVIGHDIHQNCVDLLVKRCNLLNIPLRLSLSRLKLVKKSHSPILFGRLFCDTRLLTKELNPSKENYNLITCVNDILEIKNVGDLNFYSRSAFSMTEIQNLFGKPDSIKHLLKLVHSNLLASKHILQLLFKLQILPLTKELTIIAGNTWSRSIQCARSERIDFLLMHEFYRNKYILDNVFNKFKEQMDDTKSYEGGLVFEPISGLYDNFILLLDFNSLYPSIIQEYNICFTTTVANGEESVVILDNVGVLPSILKRLVELRLNIKNIIKGEKNETRRVQLSTRQLALKLIANSIYGCLGSNFSRFHCKYIASYITKLGRELLRSTKEKVENVFNLQVIYGDTDSLMINTNIRDDGNLTNYNAANQLANNLVTFINKSHKKLEIGIDAVFTRLLLLKKKKYASLKVVDYGSGQFEREIKGLDFIRRDWSLLTKEIGNKLLNIILNSNYYDGVDGIVQEIHSTLINLNEQLNNQSIELSKFLITKQLTKNPKEYSDVQNLPHVSVALRLNEKGLGNYSTGHEISYIICTKSSATKFHTNTTSDKDNSAENNVNSSGNIGGSLSFRAFSYNEVMENGLEVDISYYKQQQLLPPILRLCSIIEGTDIQRLSRCLQIEKSIAVTQEYNYEQESKVLSLIKRSHENYRDVEINSQLSCQHCNGPVLPSFFLKYFKCNHCLRWLPLHLLRNWVDRLLYELTVQSSFCIRVCNICNVTTLNVTLGDVDRCPQPTCQSNDSMQTIFTSNKVYMYYDYLVYMLEGKLNNPLKDTETNNTTQTSAAANNTEENEENLVNVMIDLDGKLTILYDEPFGEVRTFDEVIDEVTRGSAVRASSALRLCAQHIIGLMEAIPYLRYYTLDYQKEREILCNRVKTLQLKNSYSVVDLSQLFHLLSPFSN